MHKPLPEALATLQTITEDNLEPKNYLFINNKDKPLSKNYLLANREDNLTIMAYLLLLKKDNFL